MWLVFSAILFSSCILQYDCSPAEKEPQFRSDYSYSDDAQAWFKLHYGPARWHEARKRCELEGAELATPVEVSILEAMMSGLKAHMVQSVFTGIHCNFSYGDYYSITGIPLGNMPVTWVFGGPSADREKQCVVFYHNGTIINDNCDTAAHAYICYRNHTNESPTECGTIDKDYIKSNHGACYKMHPTGETWHEAFKVCAAEGGHLIVINSEEERIFAYNLFKKYQAQGLLTGALTNEFYVGVIDWEKSRKWITIHGDDLNKAGYSTWKAGEPNNDGNKEFCVALLESEGFNDVPCDVKLPYICEMKTNSLLEKKHTYIFNGQNYE